MYGQKGYQYSNVDDDRDYDERAAGMKSRQCTDILCLFVFLASMGAMGFMFGWSLQYGDIRRLSHGFNYEGKLCGVDPDVVDRPFLYYCADRYDPATQIPTSLNQRFPICVDSCPDGHTNVMENCHTALVQNIEHLANEVKEVVAQGDLKQKAYPTKLEFDRYCIPHIAGDVTLAEELFKGNGVLNSPMHKALESFGSLRNGWGAMLSAFGMAIVLGFIYLLVLKCAAGLLVFFAIFTIIVGVIGGGIYCLVDAEGVASASKLDTLVAETGTDAATWAIGIGWALIGSGILLLTFFFCCCMRAVNVAAAMVECAVDVVFELPSMLFTPIIKGLIQLGLYSFLIYGFCWIVSIGEVKPITIDVGDLQIAGLVRDFQWDTETQYMMLAWTFGAIWIMEFIDALFQIAIAYGVCIWFFQLPDSDGERDVPCCPMIRGLFSGLVYHTGTLALGSFLISIFRVIRYALNALQKHANSSGNAVVEIIACCIACLVGCFQRFLEFVNSMAYVDVVINSTNFCSAGMNAFKAMATEGKGMAILNGATWIFTFFGVTGITALVVFLVDIMISNMEIYTANDSEWFISNKYPVLIAAGILAFFVALGFMIVFDMVSDTLLYCFYVASNSPGGQQQACIPVEMRDLLDEANQESQRQNPKEWQSGTVQQKRSSGCCGDSD